MLSCLFVCHGDISNKKVFQSNDNCQLMCSLYFTVSKSEHVRVERAGARALYRDPPP